MPNITRYPGFVEVHTHLREPSTIQDAEGIASGTLAGLWGGYVAEYDMPNNLGRKTLTVVRFDEKVEIARPEVYTELGLHAGYDPLESNPDDFGKLMAVTDSAKFYMGDTTGNSRKYGAVDYRDATNKMKEVNPDAVAFLHAHPETLDETLYMITRTFELAAHVCHVTTEILPTIEKYKQRGAALTCGVCPHHVLLSEHDVMRMGWAARMMPKLEKAPDAERLLWELAHGNIDVVETDHAPHPPENKLKAEISNPNGRVGEDEEGKDYDTCFGIPGSEFAFPLMRNLVRKKLIEEERLVDAFAYAPARIMGLTHHPETSVSFDDEVYEIGEADIMSNCGRTPYLGSFAVGRLVDAASKGISRFDSNMMPIPLRTFVPLRRGATI